MDAKRWVLQEQNQELAEKIGTALGVSPLIGQLLINRGITSLEQGRDFLECDLQNIPDPFLMLGMDPAVRRIRLALTSGERIVIYGDYDADGQTATTLLVRVLRKLAQNHDQVGYYLPDRLDEGYGLHAAALTKLAEEYTLLISVDCGISAFEEAIMAKRLGLDLIITDHHEPGPMLPEAVAILNPKQENCNYPSKDLAGVGVALKLVQALGVDTWPEYLDLVALGTVADLVPLQGENRIYVYHGLKQMVKTENLGMQALLKVSEAKIPSAGDVGFRLGPRLNAAGRLGDPTRGVRLLLTEDPTEAQKLALELHEENVARQHLEARVLEDAINIVEKYDLHKRSALVVWGKGWHQGVVGIVASRLVERYYLPTVVISVDQEQGTASARSISGLDLYQTLQECEALLTRYGGHTMAAGLSLPEDNLLTFQELFETICAKCLKPEDYLPKLRLDGLVTLGQITPQLIDQLALLEPHGIANPGPTFQTKVQVLRTRTLGREQNHLRLTVQDPSATEVSCIAFGFGDEQGELERVAENVELAFVPRFNEWNGEKTVQLQIKAWQRGEFQEDYVGRWMLDYPWQLPSPYEVSEALQKEETRSAASYPNMVDLRGTWNKAEALQKHSRPEEHTLILVNTAREVLEVCRELRVLIPGGKDFIGFEHQLLTQDERKLATSSYSWLVSTGYGLPEGKWPTVWLWTPPLNANNFEVWVSLVHGEGEVIAIYGPKDVREKQNYLGLACPDRKVLAQVYSSLGQSGERVDLELSQEKLRTMGILSAFPVAMDVFRELGLWKIEDDQILYQQPPAQKLDLNQTVLYNKVTLMRKQSLDYLKRSLERRFFQDGLKREN